MVIGAPLRCSVEPEEAYSTPKSPGAPRTPLLWPLDPLGLGFSRADFWWLPSEPQMPGCHYAWRFGPQGEGTLL